MADLFIRGVSLPPPPRTEAEVVAWARLLTAAVAEALRRQSDLFGGITDGEFVKRSGPRLIGGTPGGGGAPVGAEYVVAVAHASLTAERVATDTPTVDVDMGTADQAKWHATGLRVTGPTDLTAGAVADGEFLKRVGTTIVGAAGAAGISSTEFFLDFGTRELTFT